MPAIFSAAYLETADDQSCSEAQLQHSAVLCDPGAWYQLWSSHQAALKIEINLFWLMERHRAVVAACGAVALVLSSSSVPIHSFQSVKDSIFVRGEEGRKASATSLGPPPDLFVLFGQVAPHWGAAGRHWSHKILASGPWRMDKHTLYTYLAMSIWQVNYKYLLGLTQLNYPWSGDNKPQRCCDVGKCSAQ